MSRPLLLAVALAAWPALAGQPTKRPTDPERGKELYERHCAACHGAGGRGDGPATAALVFPVPDLVGKVKADKDRIGSVRFGKGPMPGFEATFDEADTKRVLAWFAKLDGTAPDEALRGAADEQGEEAEDAREGPG